MTAATHNAMRSAPFRLRSRVASFMLRLSAGRLYRVFPLVRKWLAMRGRPSQAWCVEPGASESSGEYRCLALRRPQVSQLFL